MATLLTSRLGAACVNWSLPCAIIADRSVFANVEIIEVALGGALPAIWYHVWIGVAVTVPGLTSILSEVRLTRSIAGRIGARGSLGLCKFRFEKQAVCAFASCWTFAGPSRTRLLHHAISCADSLAAIGVQAPLVFPSEDKGGYRRDAYHTQTTGKHN